MLKRDLKTVTMRRTCSMYTSVHMCDWLLRVYVMSAVNENHEINVLNQYYIIHVGA
jgi:hypothetical protein